MVLNRETAPAELLDSIQFAVVHLRVPSGAGSKFTVCTKASEGWNDCVVADQGASDGLAVDGYVGDDTTVEDLEGPVEPRWLLPNRLSEHVR